MEDLLQWAFIALISLVNGAIILFGKSYVKGWVEGDIAEYFKLRAEKRDRDYQIRLKAELVAELLAEWHTSNQDRKKLRELTFKAFLWLPKDLALKLSSLLSHGSPRVDIRDVVIDVRRLLLDENESEGLDKNMIITFPLSSKEETEKGKDYSEKTVK